ncbi:MAG: arylsulfatase [Verrucomicrobiales bacterium]|nr:arylsulfatase [Verrucomicrobiales bacterium]
MKKLGLLLALSISLSPAFLTAEEKASGTRPHIIFVLSDDMGWAQPGFHGSEKGLTPNLDTLAEEGLRLTAHYTHSVCAPTRGAFLTGKYSFRNWMDWRSEDFGKPSYLAKLGLTLAKNSKGEDTRRIHAMDTSEVTIAEELQKAGYFTALTGKWHGGEWLPEHLPMGQGFLHQYGHYAWGIDYYTKTIVHNAPARFAVYDWHRNQKPVDEEGYATDLIADEAARLIQTRTEEQPLFLYVAFNAVHGPLNPPPGFEGDGNDPLAIRDAMLKNLDDNIGKILGAVDEAGIRDNTLFIFANDNGPVLEEMSAPYRGTKNTTFEGGVRTPCVVRWPGHTEPGSTTDEMFFVADWFATFLNVAGIPQKEVTAIDSIDMTEVLFGEAKSKREQIIFDVEGSVRLPTIRSGDYKLMGDMLFNITKDPAETTDIAADQPEVVAELSARLKAAAAERPPLGDKPLLMEDPLPYVYGLEESSDIPEWLKKKVDAVRATQPTEWGPGETPWPQAPKGAVASKMDGGLDEKGAGPKK